MRYLLAALTFAAALYLNVSAQAEKRIFIIANNADGYGVDRCLATGATCGAAVATAYCRSREFSQGGLVPQGRSRRDHRRDPGRHRHLPGRRLRRVRRHRVLALKPSTLNVSQARPSAVAHRPVFGHPPAPRVAAANAPGPLCARGGDDDELPSGPGRHG